MKVGIDKIGFYTPNKFVDMVDLAEARNVDPGKFLIGIGQNKMAVADKSQDAVSMAINATSEYIDEIDLEKLGLLVFGTESSVDQSKSASLFVKKALNLPKNIRTFELKEACFGLTAAILTAIDYVKAHEDKTAIVIGSDIARYGVATPGEVTQGAGSISLLIKKDPSILEIDSETSMYSDDIDDFWRPNNFKCALVDGKYSTNVYLDFFKNCFEDYTQKQNLKASDFEALLFHLPFTKMGQKALKLAIESQEPETCARLLDKFVASATYSKEVGNIYTASLYMSLLSLLEVDQPKAGSLIGLFSYGSGAMAEFFTGRLVEGYEEQLYPAKHKEMLENRKKLTVSEYEEIFNDSLKDLAASEEINSDANGWYFAGTNENIRQYSKK
ncbi:hydroxymethylglutaryl-CoA synthase [Lactobacillus mulieris]|uniref:Hydroxymethylglutaryl-CoA synthase n=1 Tax=Lactobacillus mulieris TaxID=2508708 RepID=A0AAW5X009_9LACO|nr:hydroxymethylglutaryl-CoA synthase [Lactobacillus mulieris]MCZ3622597.1 hydroxymethylglutaryl-CoA synthase [Lactobacillus mulieris]MCZ3624235.1 hydroxymethylglutaryl-CoA synthase [Lactobacillus mulieris]MCZ3636604.1 hydroxymethylglutaryl-CoA synthase [Lactobacillus mulieris]MCZ3690335.1 hydroxymethylglutaryl-CoA synthase [Lactobacillus mulieris]MCZ3696304.1 hydroxymethylglutaryl-CoA synthase [Lactobacillus mulieris]